MRTPQIRLISAAKDGSLRSRVSVSVGYQDDHIAGPTPQKATCAAVLPSAVGRGLKGCPVMVRRSCKRYTPTILKQTC